MPKTPPPDKPKHPVLDPGKRSRRPGMRSVSDLLSRPAVARVPPAGPGAQQQWLDWLRARLPAELAVHVVGAVPRRDTLIVYASSAAWSTRLRYALVDGGLESQSLDGRIRRLSVRVRPPGGAVRRD